MWPMKALKVWQMFAARYQTRTTCVIYFLIIRILSTQDTRGRPELAEATGMFDLQNCLVGWASNQNQNLKPKLDQFP